MANKVEENQVLLEPWASGKGIANYEKSVRGLPLVYLEFNHLGDPILFFRCFSMQYF